MEFFTKAKFIRLRSHHNRYLIAGSDGESIKQSKNGNSRQARWSVKVVQDNPNRICLRSCYDKLLTASEESFLLGWTGNKALQTVQSDCDLSVQWEPISADFYVKLRAPLMGKFLRANAGTPPWRDTVTVDVPERKTTQDWVLWVVDILDDDAATADFDRCSWPRNSKSLAHNKSVIACYKSSYSMINNVALARYSSSSSGSWVEDESDQSVSTATSSPTTCSVAGAYKHSGFGASSAKNEGRVIHYNVVDDDGNIVDEAEGECSLVFEGSSLEELTQMLEKETGLTEFALCARSPLNGKLYPMRLALPPNHVKLHVYVVPSSCKV